MASERIISKSVNIKSNIEKNELSHAIKTSKKIFNSAENHFLIKEIIIERTPKAAIIQQLYMKITRVVKP
jgi:hypothetical protein